MSDFILKFFGHNFKILVYGIQLGVVEVAGKRIFVGGLRELFDNLNNHFYKLVGT